MFGGRPQHALLAAARLRLGLVAGRAQVRFLCNGAGASCWSAAAHRNRVPLPPQRRRGTEAPRPTTHGIVLTPVSEFNRNVHMSNTGPGLTASSMLDVAGAREKRGTDACPPVEARRMAFFA
jgi:hypothetical protein